jgi:hypothetical protein
VCTEGDGKPGGYGEALAMLACSLDYLGAAAAGGEIPEPVLLGLEAAAAKHTAARSAVLSLFDAADCHDSDGYQNSSSWLRDKAGPTAPSPRPGPTGRSCAATPRPPPGPPDRPA